VNTFAYLKKNVHFWANHGSRTTANSHTRKHRESFDCAFPSHQAKKASNLYCVEDCNENKSALICRCNDVFKYDFHYTINNDYKDYWIFNDSNINKERSFNIWPGYDYA